MGRFFYLYQKPKTQILKIPCNPQAAHDPEVARNPEIARDLQMNTKSYIFFKAAS